MTLSYAQSLDGSIAMSRGTPYALSGSESQVLTHKLRAAHDAILVGINTVVADNPYLTVRLVEGQSPLPIVLDSRLRLPLNSNLLKNKTPPLVATTTSASQERQRRIEESGAKIIRTTPDERGWVDLRSLLDALADLGIKKVMVEGGARVITSFLSQHLVDWIVITIAPTFLGGLHALENPLTSCNREGCKSSGLPEFKNSGYEQVGKDIVFWSALSWANP
ncbi:MAG TPA: RibD family protein [Dehalococcoidales bacterium]